MKSILNFPDRGKWGDAKYRGNCSGWVIHQLLRHFQPKHFIEIFAGSGTGYEVAKELGYTDSIHLDLNPDFGSWNALKDEIPVSTDFAFLHPPYYNIIPYSGHQWGRQAHPDDLSHCKNYDDFIRRLNFIHAKVFTNLRSGGRMAILIGDIRQNGIYYSIQKDMKWFGQLESHIIKAQHNCFSEQKRYRGKFIPIVHEHLLIFKKNDMWIVPIVVTEKQKQDLRESEKVTWRSLILATLETLDKPVHLNVLYNYLKDSKKARKNPHWKEKIRQTLQIYNDFISVSRGVWTIKNRNEQCA